MDSKGGRKGKPSGRPSQALPSAPLRRESSPSSVSPTLASDNVHCVALDPHRGPWKRGPGRLPTAGPGGFGGHGSAPPLAAPRWLLKRNGAVPNPFRHGAYRGGLRSETERIAGGLTPTPHNPISRIPLWHHLSRGVDELSMPRAWLRLEGGAASSRLRVGLEVFGTAERGSSGGGRRRLGSARDRDLGSLGVP